jgi:hypothetical protein
MDGPTRMASPASGNRIAGNVGMCLCKSLPGKTQSTFPAVGNVTPDSRESG